MRPKVSLRWFLMALIFALVPASSFAGVFISVGFAPPVLPVYEQPPCPGPNLVWTPGYWAYGEDGYYWVPGAWVPAPYYGALWTPPYWGWEGGIYSFHPGYWGHHVGYYGGVNYGYGYMGVGFSGGMWRGNNFVYNTAVMRVDTRIIHTTYIDREVVIHNTIINDRHVGYAGGPGGIRHDPMPEERMAEREQHMERTSYQMQHENSARGDHNSYARFNGGRPSNVVAARPLAAESRPAPSQMNRQGMQNGSPQQTQSGMVGNRSGFQPSGNGAVGNANRPGNQGNSLNSTQQQNRFNSESGTRATPGQFNSNAYGNRSQQQNLPQQQNRSYGDNSRNAPMPGNANVIGSRLAQQQQQQQQQQNRQSYQPQQQNRQSFQPTQPQQQNRQFSAPRQQSAPQQQSHPQAQEHAAPAQGGAAHAPEHHR